MTVLNHYAKSAAFTGSTVSSSPEITHHDAIKWPIQRVKSPLLPPDGGRSV